LIVKLASRLPNGRKSRLRSGARLTIYEFFIESESFKVRLEVPVGGLLHAAQLFRRLDDYAASGKGRIVSEANHPLNVEGLTLDDARYLLEGIDMVYVGTPGEPAQGDLTPTDQALQIPPDDAMFNAFYFEI
jgi:hypothetical protein